MPKVGSLESLPEGVGTDPYTKLAPGQQGKIPEGLGGVGQNNLLRVVKALTPLGGFEKGQGLVDYIRILAVAAAVLCLVGSCCSVTGLIKPDFVTSTPSAAHAITTKIATATPEALATATKVVEHGASSGLRIGAGALGALILIAGGLVVHSVLNHVFTDN